MERERLLEIITGEKEPNFVSEREYCIIDKCLVLINSLESEKKVLRFMIDNGLGDEDMRNDITYPHEL